MLCLLWSYARALNTNVVENKDFVGDIQSRNPHDSLSVLLITIEEAGHSIPMLSLGEALMEKGHKVTMLAVETKSLGSNTTMTNLRTWCWERNIPFVSAGVITMDLPTFTDDHFSRRWGKTISFLAKFTNLMSSMQEILLNVLVEDKLELVSSSDAAVLDFFFAPSMEWLHGNTELTVISLTQTIPFSSNTVPSWYYPTFPANPQAPANPNIVDRFLNILVSGVMAVVMNTVGRSVQGLFPINSQSGTRYPDIAATSFGFDYPRPLYPLTHYVGPVVSNRKQPLEENLKHWLDSHTAPHSVVYLSMGSVLSLNGNLARAIVHGVMEAGYDLLWSLKLTNREILEEIDGEYINSSRILISKWTPQATVLQHPSVSMAVLHGGFGGVNEALIAGVPIICFPHFGDQPMNCARVKNQGLGVDFGVITDLSVLKIKEAIQYIEAHDCREKAKKVSKIFRKAGGASKAVELIEYYHEMGYDHLVPSWAKYNWTFIQYYNLDVYVLLGVVFYVLLFVSRRTCLLYNYGKRSCFKKTIKTD